jgi:hypothetical protein
MPKCFVTKKIGTEQPCEDEAVAKTPFGRPVCASCLFGVLLIMIVLDQLEADRLEVIRESQVRAASAWSN